MQLPVSELKLYLQCPRAFKFHVIDGVEPQSTSLSCCRITAMQKIMAELHGNPFPGRDLQYLSATAESRFSGT